MVDGVTLKTGSGGEQEAADFVPPGRFSPVTSRPYSPSAEFLDVGSGKRKQPRKYTQCPRAAEPPRRVSSICCVKRRALSGKLTNTVWYIEASSLGTSSRAAAAESPTS